jgi:4-amino-4-deoxy-L-arabinose transferase-like glycosyltransferase
VRELIRQNRWHFVIFALAGIALRLVFVFWFPHYAGDSLLYSDIAQNWLHQGTYALTENGAAVPTLIRLPGYPAFLALLFKLFAASPEKMLPVLLVQTFVDVCGCFVVAALALELFNERCAKLAFAFAALCPFTANYVALPLTETLAIFSAALALLLGIKAIRNLEEGGLSPKAWLSCGAAIGAGLLLRPDGGILLAALVIFLLSKAVTTTKRRQFISVALLVSFVAIVPLAPWALRNWKTFHVFQPLAPRYANAPDEYVPTGFNRWIKTWLVEYVSVEDVFWNVSTETPGETVHVESLPTRAFDSQEEHEQTEAAFAEFNQTLILTSQTDERFSQLANKRIASSPLRYYVYLPAMRTADMWLRPRTETLPVDQRWWTFDDPPESSFAIAYGCLNLLLVGAAVVGICRFRQVRAWGWLVGFLVLRSIFLSTMENPEPRYTLECFPVILVIAAAVISRYNQASVAK